MNVIQDIKQHITSSIQSLFPQAKIHLDSVVISLNIGKQAAFGDLSINAAMVLAPALGQKPREIAETIKSALESDSYCSALISSIEIVGPGFINLHLKQETFKKIAEQLYTKHTQFFKPDIIKPKKYLIEFVSANPTGPLHLGHGRGGIIGDVLAHVLSFLGHNVLREFYINDAGNQVQKLATSLRIRIRQTLGEAVELPEEGYAGEYLINLAHICIKQYGNAVLEKDDEFFKTFAVEHLLNLIKQDLHDYGINFDSWFSEKTLHENGEVDAALELLAKKDLIYKEDGALWFKSTQFGDDKDRVIKKQDGALTYIAADIAYHKNKYDRGYTQLVDVLGQDHHGYVMRLKATMEALGYTKNSLDVILYQLVSIKQGSEAVKMSKRKGTFTTLRDIIDTVGKDVARFFYLNRKAEAHLEFDLDTALKQTEENPAFYIQYAYVRTASLFNKALETPELQEAALLVKNGSVKLDDIMDELSTHDKNLLIKIASLQDVLLSVQNTYQTHVLAYYTYELAQSFHNYYAFNRIIDTTDIKTSTKRLLLVLVVRNTLALCLNLQGLSQPEKM
jgi:arginyl-tRNA synthetase